MSIFSSIFSVGIVFSLSLYFLKNSQNVYTSRFPILIKFLALIICMFSGCLIFSLPAYTQNIQHHFVAARVKPNPASEIIELIADSSYLNQKFQILSGDGVVHLQAIISEERTLIPIQFLGKGIYYVYFEKAYLPLRFIKQ